MNLTLNLSEMMLFLKTFANLIMVEATFLSFSTQDAMTHAGAGFAIVLAFMLRIALEWGKNELSFKNVVIQAISTVALCFVSVYVWHDFLNYKKGFEIYVFTCSLFAVFIVAEVEIMFKIGFRKYLKSVLLKVMASDDKEIKK